MLTFAPARPRGVAPALRLRIGLAVAAGLPGIAALALVLPEIPGVPTALMLLNPLLMLVLLASLGAVAQARLPFRVRAFARLAGRDLPIAPPGSARLVAFGILLGLGLAAVDHATRGLWQAGTSAPSLVDAWSPQALVVGLLYGGVLEEILMRFGVLSLVVLALWRVFARRAARPPRWAVVAGVVVSAAAFAAAHLPVAFASGAEPSLALAVRILALNGVAGLVFGHLYATRDLESAMLAHAAAHVGFALAALGG